MYVGEENMPEKTFYNEKLDAKAGWTAELVASPSTDPMVGSLNLSVYLRFIMGLRGIQI
jgi:hypothetical protein